MLIVANPVSGKGRGARTAERLAGILGDGGVDVEIAYTSASGDARRIAEEQLRSDAGKHDCYVACGGDGTIQEVAHALATAKEGGGPGPIPALGLAPSGRCNDFARELGVGTDPVDQAEILLSGRRVSLDLGKVNDRYFCTVATAGIDAEVSRFVDRMKLPLRGRIAYVYGALRVLARYRAPRVHIEADFGVVDGPIFLASSANTPSYGGAIPIAPGASPTDGLLHVCVIDALPRLAALRLVPAVLAGRHPRRAGVRVAPTRALDITSDPPLELWADGEPIAHTPARIEAVPDAIEVMLPRGA